MLKFHPQNKIKTMSSNFNTEQKEAITYNDGPLLVIAGAGSGKTRVITHKIVYLIEHAHIHPKSIYALTFTNKAAEEMRTRAQSLLSARKTKTVLNIMTFHSLGLLIIKTHANRLGFKANFSLFDALDSFNLLKALSADLSPVSEDNLKGIQNRISTWKNNLVSCEEAFQNAQGKDDLAARFYCAYQDTLKAYNAVDFDDLILLPVMLFESDPEILNDWQNKIRYLMVDEYQDTNTVQYRMLHHLCKISRALTVVGDDDQSIYAWRGARPENIQKLHEDFLTLKVIKLEQNYRSTSTILSAANHLIGHNPHIFEKKLWSTLGTGDKIRVIANATESAEVERIVLELSVHQFNSRKPFGEYAILYRSNHQAKYIEQALRERAIPYQISGGTSFFDRVEIKDLFAYFRVMINPLDDAAFLRCVNTPRREIGPSTLQKLAMYAKERNSSLFNACFEYGLSQVISETAQQKLYEFVEMIQHTFEEAKSDDCINVLNQFIVQIGYEDFLNSTTSHPNVAKKKMDNVKDLINWFNRLINEQEHSFEEAIAKMILLDMIDKGQTHHENYVQLMTLHAAKGLEFAHVFISGWEEEILPHKNSIEANTIEEERRLAYVGMTRAKETLTITYAQSRKRFGEYESTTPSRFLYELPQEYLDWEENKGEPVEVNPDEGKNRFAALKEMLKD